MKLDLFVVDKEYIDFIQEAEKYARGFTKVPNMHYPDGKAKLVCGVVLMTFGSGMNYYVGLTSYKVQKSENILIKTNDKYDPVKGSLRFNYMFPVPDKCLTKKVISDEMDFSYKKLLLKEYKFIKSNEQIIMDKAKEVYDKITTGIDCSQNLKSNSCDFTLLESFCKKYSAK